MSDMSLFQTSANIENTSSFKVQEVGEIESWYSEER